MSFVELSMKEHKENPASVKTFDIKQTSSATFPEEHSIVCEACGTKALRIGRHLFHCALCETSIILPQTLTVTKEKK